MKKILSAAILFAATQTAFATTFSAEDVAAIGCHKDSAKGCFINFKTGTAGHTSSKSSCGSSGSLRWTTTGNEGRTIYDTVLSGVFQGNSFECELKDCNSQGFPSVAWCQVKF